MARVIISSGHTSDNPGVVENGLREYDLARKIAKYVLKYTRQSGIISLATPPNLDLAGRIQWINSTGYNTQTNDIAIEIHINDGGNSGIEGWFLGDGQNRSQELTEKVVASLTGEINLPSVGVKSEFQHPMGAISFINAVLPIGSVIECGFIDNQNDIAILRDEAGLDKMGRGIAKGILKYFKIETEIAPQEQNQQAYNATNTGMANRVNYGGGNTNNFPGGAGTSPNVAPAPTNETAFLPREERKTMIIQNYAKILGREPSDNDLNYFLNIGIREDDLIKKMVNSQEHVDLVKARQEVLTTRIKMNNEQTELMQLRTQSAEYQTIIDGLNASIVQKNEALTRLQQRIRELEQSKNFPTTGGKDKTPSKSSGKKYKGNFSDRIFKVFSDILE